MRRGFGAEGWRRLVARSLANRVLRGRPGLRRADRNAARIKAPANTKGRPGPLAGDAPNERNSTPLRRGERGPAAHILAKHPWLKKHLQEKFDRMTRAAAMVPSESIYRMSEANTQYSP
jgi:hypothetical protein